MKNGCRQAFGDIFWKCYLNGFIIFDIKNILVSDSWLFEAFNLFKPKLHDVMYEGMCAMCLAEPMVNGNLSFSKFRSFNVLCPIWFFLGLLSDYVFHIGFLFD